jgi:protein-L-isoaspartate(D-aspartate) O-methyltransferase
MSRQYQFIDTYKHKGLRRHLAESVRRKGIKDENIIMAIEKVPRHFFLDSAFAEQAYEDKAMPIDEGQTISQPYTVAYQTELLEIKQGDKILEIGTGSGYQACILLELGADVYSIERFKSLSDKAGEMLARLNYFPKLFAGDGTLGLKEHAPFNKILITAAAPSIPQPLVDQLVVGGYLVLPLGDRDSQVMVRIIKTSENKIIRQNFEQFRFVPLIGKEGWEN